jgi:hypothetical protein
MRGYQIEKNIKFEELQSRLQDCPEPKIEDDCSVIVDVYCAGLNFFDLLQIEVSTRSSLSSERLGNNEIELGRLSFRRANINTNLHSLTLLVSLSIKTTTPGRCEYGSVLADRLTSYSRDS